VKDALDALGASSPANSNDIVLTHPKSPRTAPWCDRRDQQTARHGIDRLPDRQEPDRACRELRHSFRNRAFSEHAGKTGTDDRRACPGEGAGKYYMTKKEVKSHRRMRRLSATDRLLKTKFQWRHNAEARYAETKTQKA